MIQYFTRQYNIIVFHMYTSIMYDKSSKIWLCKIIDKNLWKWKCVFVNAHSVMHNVWHFSFSYTNILLFIIHMLPLFHVGSSKTYPKYIKVSLECLISSREMSNKYLFLYGSNTSTLTTCKYRCHIVYKQSCQRGNTFSYPRKQNEMKFTLCFPFHQLTSFPFQFLYCNKHIDEEFWWNKVI